MSSDFTLSDEDDAPWLDCMDGIKASIEREETPVPTEPMTDLRTLDDHNRSALEAFTLSSGPCPNGIACPECGQELVDSNPSVCLTSWPPQYSVHCPACGYSGYRR